MRAGTGVRQMRHPGHEVEGGAHLQSFERASPALVCL